MQLVATKIDPIERDGRQRGVQVHIIRSFFSQMLLACCRATVIRGSQTSLSMKAGPVILACNHVSLLDGLLIAFASPIPLVFTSETLYSRKKWHTRFLFKVLSLMGYGWVLQLDSTAPMGLRAALRQLAMGRSILIFPEGKIASVGKPSVEMPGLAWLAARSEAPVIRIRIEGADQSRIFAKNGGRWWPSITIHF